MHPSVIGVIKKHYYQCCRAGDFHDNTTVKMDKRMSTSKES